MTKTKAFLGKLALALLTPEARKSELVLLRIIFAALGIKLGVKFVDAVG